RHGIRRTPSHRRYSAKKSRPWSVKRYLKRLFGPQGRWRRARHRRRKLPSATLQRVVARVRSVARRPSGTGYYVGRSSTPEQRGGGMQGENRRGVPRSSPPGAARNLEGETTKRLRSAPKCRNTAADGRGKVGAAPATSLYVAAWKNPPDDKKPDQRKSRSS